MVVDPAPLAVQAGFFLVGDFVGEAAPLNKEDPTHQEACGSGMC